MDVQSEVTKELRAAYQALLTEGKYLMEAGQHEAAQQVTARLQATGSALLTSLLEDDAVAWLVTRKSHNGPGGISIPVTHFGPFDNPVEAMRVAGLLETQFRGRVLDPTHPLHNVFKTDEQREAVLSSEFFTVHPVADPFGKSGMNDGL